MKLIVEHPQAQPEQTDATSLIRWCFNPAEREKIRKAKEAGRRTGPYLLLIIVHPESGKEERRWYSLPDQIIDWFTFIRPGRHLIHALVLFPTEGEPDFSRKYFGRAGQFRYKHQLCLPASGELYLGAVGKGKDRDEDEDEGSGIPQGEYFCNEAGQLIRETVEVIVPKEYFALEPAAWRKAIVREFFDVPERDQCQFRKRFWFAALPLWILKRFWFIFFIPPLRLLWGLIGFLGGVKGINFRPIWHPFSQRFKDIWDGEFNPEGCDGRYNPFITNRKGERRHWYWVIFIPAIWTILGIMVFVFAIVENKLPTGEALLVSLILALGSLVAVAILCAFGLFVVWLVITTCFNLEQKQRRKARRQERRKRQRLIEMQERQREEDELWADLACEVLPLKAPTSLDVLPKRRRTFHLKFGALKKDVCRPFAQ